MILSKKPKTLAEVKDIIKDIENKQLNDYLKSFSKLSIEKSEKLKSELTILNNLKVKEEDIIKLVDFIPKDKEEVNKILSESTLSEEETNEILSITAKY